MVNDPVRIIQNSYLHPFKRISLKARIMLKLKKKAISPKAIVEEKLASGHKILPFPQVVGQLLAALKDPNSNSQTYAKIIEADAALTVRLLRMVNSPVYGNSNVIKSVGRATTILGGGPLKNIALTFAASTVFSGKGNDNKEALWNHSLGCATTARQLAKASKYASHDDAFLAGIFHDVGKLFFFDAIPEVYSELTESVSGLQLAAKETEMFGVTHEEVGFKLVTGWQMPEHLMIAVGYHHHPQNAVAHADLAALIYIADGLAKSAGIGSDPDSSTSFLEEANGFLGLSEEQIETVAEEALGSFEETKQACSN